MTLTNSPRHLANINIVAPLASEKLSAGFDLQYVSARRTIGGNEVPGTVIPNLTLFGRLAKHVDVSASVYNLFDHIYSDPGSEEHRQDAIVQYGSQFSSQALIQAPIRHGGASGVEVEFIATDRRSASRGAGPGRVLLDSALSRHRRLMRPRRSI